MTDLISTRRITGDEAAKHGLVLAKDVTALSEEQRAAVLEFFETHPDGGYKQALLAAGIAATKAEARALLHGDEEIREARFKSMHLDEASLFRTLGQIAGDGDHKDQFRAVTWGLNAIHRWAEMRATEHTGPDGGPVEVTNPELTAAIDRFAANLRQLTERRAQSGGAVRAVEPGRAELPPGGAGG